MKLPIRWRSIALLCISLVLPISPALSSDFPNRPVRLMLPYAVGGASDILARGFATRLSKALGQNVVVENRGGSGGTVGTIAALRAEADGYTLLMQSGALSMEIAMNKKLPYDARKDLVPVIQLAKGPFVLLVNPSLPIRSVSDLIDYAKRNPGKLNYASSGVGSSIHMSSELFKAMAGIEATHVAYQGIAPAYSALAANDIQFVFDVLGAGRRFSEGGRARAIAVSTSTRTPIWQQMPTVAESGLPGYESWVWYGLFVRAGTPREIVEKLNRESRAVLESAEMREWLLNQGFEPGGGHPDDVRNLMDTETVRWSKLIVDAGLKFD